MPGGSSGEFQAIVAQFAKIVTRMKASNGAHSTSLMAQRRGAWLISRSPKVFDE